MCTLFAPPLMSAPPPSTFVPGGQTACAHLNPSEPPSTLRPVVTARPATAEADGPVSTATAAAAVRMAPAIDARRVRLAVMDTGHLGTSGRAETARR
jgi:hypothetical protein